MYNKIICCLFVISFLCLTNAFATLPQTHPLPHDNNLSVYIGYQGTWYNYNTQTNETREIEAQFASFSSSENISTDWAVLANRSVNSPALPDNWKLYYPDDNEPYNLRVVVQDNMSRLGSASISDAITNANIGTVYANASHTLIDELISIPITNEGVNLVLKDTNNSTLGQTSSNPVTCDQIIILNIPLIFWKPNVMYTPHTGCTYTQTGIPIGNPEDPTGKQLYLGSMPLSYYVKSCISEYHENDSAETASYMPTDYALLKNQKMVSDTLMGSLLDGMPPTELQTLNTAAVNMRQVYINNSNINTPIIMPPFSKGLLHWKNKLIGKTQILAYVPYKGRSIFKLQVTGQIQAKINDQFGAGSSGSTPDEIVLSLNAALNSEKKLEPYEIRNAGVLYILVAELDGIPGIFLFAQPITEPVGFELYADIKPDGTSGLSGGSSQLTRGTYWTASSPPSMFTIPGSNTFPSFGPNLGKYSLELPKGWKWTVTGTPNAAWYTTASVGPFETGSVFPNPIQLYTQLNVLLSLKIKTNIIQNGIAYPEASRVQLEKQNGTTWTSVISNDLLTSLQGNEQVALKATNALGHYRVRAQSMMGSTWTEWFEFDAIPAVSKDMTLTVTR